MEFLSERHLEINTIMETIGLYKESQEILNLMSTAPEIKERINHNSIIISQIQELIPTTGMVTNYNITNNNSNETCDKAVRDNNCD